MRATGENSSILTYITQADPRGTCITCKVTCVYTTSYFITSPLLVDLQPFLGERAVVDLGFHEGAVVVHVHVPGTVLVG